MKPRVRILISMMFVMSGLLTSVSGFAQVPATMTYNGFLMSSGLPANSPADVSFKIFDAESGGTSLWQQSPASVDIKDGRFSAHLSNLNASIFNGQTRWLEVTINNETLSPHSEVSSMPYAFRAGDAQTIQGKTPAELGGGGGGPDTLASLNCAAGQIALFTAGNWACTNMPSYSGTNFATSGQNCPAGQIVTGIAADGKVTCAADKDTNTTYTGANFATSGQNCPAGQIVSGISATGAVTCVADKNDNTTYSGTNFATSGQACPAGQIVSGIAADGKVTCVADKNDNTTYSGTNFATSGQACPAGQIVSGISAAGAVTCIADKNDNTTYTAGAGLSLGGTTFSVSTGGITNTHLAGSIDASKIVVNPSFTGTVTATGFKYVTAKSITKFISHHSFVTDFLGGGISWKNELLYGKASGGSGASQKWGAVAVLDIPVGSTIKKMGCQYVDRSSAHEMIFHLSLIHKAATSHTRYLADRIGNESTGLVTASAELKQFSKNVNHIVFNHNNVVFELTIDLPQGTSPSLEFHGCRIEYEMTSP